MSASLSRAEVEAMDRDELVETVVDLSATVKDQQLSIDVLIERVNETEDRLDGFDNVLDRLDALEAENERLRERIETSGGKGQKVADIVQYADNTRDSDAAVKLTAKEIKGATGCSRRYAYDLMDELPEEYDWFLTPQEMRQYGSIQIDNVDARRLGIDFEGVHSSGCPVNKFTTTPTEEDRSE